MTSSENATIENFEELYGKYGPMVLRRCRFLLKDEDKALDSMQDVFVRILERQGRMNGMCASLFYTVATNVCLNRIRSDFVRRSPQIDGLLDEMADKRSVHHEKLTDAGLFLDYIFSDIKEDTRTMAVLHYVDGLTLEETAAEMSMSVSGVRKRLSVLRKKALTCGGE
jgi:RNA polymerase sigma-70 factor (ECF subfamily)